MEPSHYDLDSPTFIKNPYPTYRALQAEAPVWWNDRWGRWTLSRHADVEMVLRSSSFRTKPIASFVNELRSYEFAQSFCRWFVFQEPKVHKALRRPMNGLFSRTSMARCQPRIQAFMDDLLDAVADKDEIDFSIDIAHPLSIAAVLDIIGLPCEDAPLIGPPIDDLAETISRPILEEDIPRTEAAYKALEAYLQDAIDHRRRHKGDDFISRFIEIFDDDLMIISQSIVVILGAYESVPNFLGSGLLSLLQAPSELERLKADLSLVDNAVEEMLRYESPIQLVHRIPQEDVEVAGHAFEKGQNITLLLGAANRDPTIFEDPDRFDITRTNLNRQIAFGKGPHLCIGAPLNKIQGRVAFTSLLTRFPDVRLAEPNGPRWKPYSVRFRSLEGIRVAL